MMVSILSVPKVLEIRYNVFISKCKTMKLKNQESKKVLFVEICMHRISQESYIQ